MTKSALVIVLALLMHAKAQADSSVLWGQPYPKIYGPGGVQFKNSDTLTGCSAGVAGSIHYNAGVFEGCNGTAWATLGSSTAGGVTALANVGGGTAATGGGITAGTLTLFLANASGPGLMGTGTQTFAGTKTFSTVIGANITGTASTVGAFTSTPTACGANSYAVGIAPNGNLTCAAVSGGGAQVFNATDLAGCAVGFSVASSAATISILTQAGGTPAPTTACTIAFRNATAANSGYATLSVTAATTLVIANGQSMGCAVTAATCLLNVYAINNAGSVQLAAMTGDVLDERELQSTTGIGTAATIGILYSGTAAASIPIRLMGRVQDVPAAAYAWTANPTSVAPNHFTLKPPTSTVFTAAGSGTYTTPVGAVRLKVTMVGGGAGGSGMIGTPAGQVGAGAGGGGGATCISSITAPMATFTYAVGAGGNGGNGTSNTQVGTAGSVSVIGAYSLTAGAGNPYASTIGPSTNPNTIGPGGVGGTASGCSVNIRGGSGDIGLGLSVNYFAAGSGGSTTLGSGGVGATGATSSNGGNGGVYGGGGGGGGNAGNGGTAATTGGNGAPGIIIIEEYYQ